MVKRLEEFQDDAMMAYDRPRTADFNVVARYSLGWLNSSHVLHTSSDNYISSVSDLDESLEDNLVLMLADCSFCSSINPEISGGSGNFTSGGEIGRMTDRLPCDGVWLRWTAGSYNYKWHGAPRRQIIATLNGHAEAHVRAHTAVQG